MDGLGEGVSLNVKPSATPAVTQVLTFKIEFRKPGELFKELKIRTDMQAEPLPLTVEATVAAN